MTASKRPAGGRAAAGAALQQRVAELEAANRDLLAKLEVAERTRQAHESLSAILEATADLAVSADVQGRIHYLNRAGRELLGLDPANAPSLPGIHPAWAAELVSRDGIPTAIRDGVWRGETAVRSRTGQDVQVAQVILAHRDAAGQVWGLSTVLRDLSSAQEAERQHRDNGCRFAAASAERQRAEKELDRSRIRLRALASELTLAEARERRRLAAALHDEVGQGLALSRIKLGLLGHLLGTEEARVAFTELRDLFARMSQQIRTLTFELSPPVLYQLGLAAAVEWLAETLERELPGVRCRTECHGSTERVDETVSILVFQSVRELLANVAKHAQAKDVVITLTSAAGWVTLTVQDDGVGFDPQTVATLSHKQDSFGLFSIGERMRYVNGTLEIDSAPGRGTRVTISAPTTAAGR